MSCVRIVAKIMLDGKLSSLACIVDKMFGITTAMVLNFHHHLHYQAPTDTQHPLLFLESRLLLCHLPALV